MEYKVPNHQRGKGKEQQLCLVGPFAITRDQIQAHLVIINFISTKYQLTNKFIFL